MRFVTSGLKTLLYGITFSGDLEFWKMSIRTASGEVLFDTTPIPVLMNLPFRDGTAQPSDADTNPNDVLLRPNAPIKTWDPNWVIDGTQALQMDADVIGSTYVSVDGTDRGVMNLALHVYELPGSNEARGPASPRQPPQSMIPALRAVPGGRV